MLLRRSINRLDYIESIRSTQPGQNYILQTRAHKKLTRFYPSRPSPRVVRVE